MSLVSFWYIYAYHKAKPEQRIGDDRDTILIKCRNAPLFIGDALIIGRTNKRPVCSVVTKHYAKIFVNVPAAEACFFKQYVMFHSLVCTADYAGLSVK